MKKSVLILCAVCLMACGAPNYNSGALSDATVNAVGVLFLDSSTDPEPPGQFLLKVRTDWWWVAVESQELLASAESFARRNAKVVVSGSTSLSPRGEPVFAANSIKERILRMDAPTTAECERGADMLLRTYGDLLSGAGLSLATDGECAVTLYFNSTEALESYRQNRFASGLDVEKLTFQNSLHRDVVIEIRSEVSGEFVPFPGVIVSN